MFWAGPVVCPECKSPLDVDATTCPYCYSTSPRSAPWNASPIEHPGWTLAVVLTIAAAIAAAVASDAYLGTNWISQFISAWSDAND